MAILNMGVEGTNCNSVEIVGLKCTQKEPHALLMGKDAIFAQNTTILQQCVDLIQPDKQ